jgi:ligand-binding sensor domain-containing protein
MRALLVFLLFTISYTSLQAQYPSYFSYTIENGAPTNEIYCILQDKQGYIWIGCDAGVYRYNGITFEHFSSPDLTARSATGLRQSPSGRIYGYNFNSQVFYIEKDKLTVLKNWKNPVNGIATDEENHMWISGSNGTFKLNETTLKWELVAYVKHRTYQNDRYFTDNMRSDNQGKIYYNNNNNLIVWDKTIPKSFPLDKIQEDLPIAVAKSAQKPWLFGITNATVFKPETWGWSQYISAELGNLLKNKKVNTATVTNDGIVWICTHSGLIKFNPTTGKSELLYSQMAFSDCIIDRENNYWFSTLHDGLIRIPEMNIRTWKVHQDEANNNQFSHIVSAENKLFFASTAGLIADLNLNSQQIFKIEHEPKSDFGMLYSDPIDQCIYFNKLNILYKYKNGQIELVNEKARPIKSMLHHQQHYFILSSQGLFVTKDISSSLDNEKQIVDDWCRDIAISPFSRSIFVGANKGLYEFTYKDGKWVKSKLFLKEKQIISIDTDSKNKLIYLLTFEGKIYSLNKSGQLELFKELDQNTRVTQLKLFKGSIYLSCNKGIIVVDIKTKQSYLVDSFSGLSSNNVSSISFTENYCWAATGKGIQQIPIDIIRKRAPSSKVVLREVRINNSKRAFNELKEIKFNEQLTIVVDGLSYRSNRSFEFAYRIKGFNNSWIKVPGSAGKIEFPQLPSGNITIEIKLIDHRGFDSENILSFNYHVHAPFWQRWWFYLLIVMIVAIIAFIFFRRKEIILRRNQLQELKNLKLENELRLSQQSALKAQMNPHFIFNVLNSIKGYIYENDKKNAAKYLSDFSNLVRKVLEFSSLPEVSLELELEVLKLYIELEEMLLQNEFSYQITIDENIDPSSIKIPALLIQPFIENAFKHGLRHKKGSKNLSIHVSYDNITQSLLICINDNGIGREAAKELNERYHSDHHPFATEALERRLELLNYEKKGLVGVEILDKFDAEEKPIGTTVNIRIHV